MQSVYRVNCVVVFSICFIRAIRALILIVSFSLLFLKFMPVKKIWHKKTVSLRAEWFREALGQAVTHHHDHASTALIKRWQDLFPRVYQQGPSTDPETESFHHNLLYGMRECKPAFKCANASIWGGTKYSERQSESNCRNREKKAACFKEGWRAWMTVGKEKKKLLSTLADKRRKINPILCHEIGEKIIIGQRSGGILFFLQRQHQV